MQPLLDISQACRILNLSKSKIYKLTSRREIRFIKAGSKVLFRPEDLQSFIDGHLVEPIQGG
jgi:excisionase family DNA binding protein